MRPKLRPVYALTVALALSIPPAITHSQESESRSQRIVRLRADLQPVLSAKISNRLRGLGDSAAVGLAVLDADSGELIFDQGGNQSFAAASNAKIVTAAAALSLLGPEFRFRTELLAESVDANGRIPGNLYIRGRGNAFFGETDMTRLVLSLKARGVTRIGGGIVVDNSYFDQNNSPPHFDEQPSEHASFRAPIAATSYTFNAWTLKVRPSLSGSGPARVEVSPPNDYVQVKSTVSTIRRGRTRIRMQTTEEENRLSVVLSGQVRREIRRRRFRKRVPDPTRFVGTGLRRALINAGVAVRKRSIVSAPTPEQAVQMAVHNSVPLAVAIRGMGKYSNNFIAELLLKVIGAETRAEGQPATWEHGLDAVRGFLERAGVKEDSYRYENGSGLFDSNRFTPKQLVKVLQLAQKEYRWGPDLLASLSISGTDGTLRRRMEGTPAERRVRAKTGTLDHASALSGVAAVDGNSPLLFSILINGFPETSIGIARALQDDIAEELVRALSGG